MTRKQIINETCAWALIIMAIIGGGCVLVMLDVHAILASLASIAMVAAIIWIGNKTSE